MEINLTGIGKRFRKEWIFRNVDLSFTSSKRYALVGHNGSGKSTLLQLIATIAIPTEGEILYRLDKAPLTTDKTTSLISFSSPYQELIEEFTGLEMVDFHFRFRSQVLPTSSQQFLQAIGLGSSATKQIKFFSSGMKQRLRLALCVYTQANVYLLDEPTTNLDQQGAGWYAQLISQLPANKIVIISSNIENEFKMCDVVINIADYKGKA